MGYIAFVAAFLFNFLEKFETAFFAVITMLTVFSLSILTCGLIAVAYPAYLAYNKNYKGAAANVITIVLTGIVILSIVVTIAPKREPNNFREVNVEKRIEKDPPTLPPQPPVE